ncbi:MAG: hypothetical protein C0425_07110 [Chlorobiaceae bacterium]|nr:hypothetical protein [Chlorobiaceae bacterium]MBA4310092.1 hypothetical protein [Chlorobiaceae bacterium]
MIDKNTLTQQWINEVSKTNRNADKILIEKVIRALLLLEGLSKAKLPFILKGGTALMLLLNSAKRLSIDIDIIVSKAPKNFEEMVQEVGKVQGFNRVILQERKKNSKIEKVHYKFFYTPVHKTHSSDDYVLLDIIFESNNYSNVSFYELQSQFVSNIGTAVQIQMPSLEDLLGDKLTAFAPNTTGIPYLKNENSMSMEIIKQLYDIGNLFDVVSDSKIIKTTFDKIVRTETNYRNLKKVSPFKVLEDIYQTSLCISLRGNGGNGNFAELQSGIQRITGFIFSEPYHLEKAIAHSAKAAYLTQLIATNQTTFEKYSDAIQVQEAVIKSPHNTRLQKLKRSNTEAFFYWWKATQLVDNYISQRKDLTKLINKNEKQK